MPSQMGVEQVQIVATARDQASPTLKKLQANVTALGSKGRGPLGGLLSGLGGISPVAMIGAAGIGVLTAALADGVAGALAEDKQLARLGAALQANIPNWDGSTAAVEAANKAAMNLAFSDDDAREGMIKLIGATHDQTEAIKELRLAQDLARFSGTDLTTAADTLVKVHAHSYRGLKALGIQIKANATSEQALAAIQAVVYGQAEAYANTTAGKFESAQVKVNDAMEGFGRDLINATAGLLGVTDALGGNAQATVDYVRALNFAIPFAGAMADELQRQIDLIGKTKGILRKTLIPDLADVGDEAGKVMATHFGNSWTSRLADARARSAKQFADNFTDDLAGALRDNKGVVKSAMHDMLWALNHPQALERQLKRIQTALGSSALATLLSSDNPMQRAIGQQIQSRLNGQFETLTGTTYQQGVTSIVGAINGLRPYLHMSYTSPPVFGWQPPTPTPAPYVPAIPDGQRYPGASAPQSDGHGHPVIMDGRMVARLIDERLGRSLSLAPAGVVNRG